MAPMSAEAGMVRTHAQTILPAIPHRFQVCEVHAHRPDDLPASGERAVAQAECGRRYQLAEPETVVGSSFRSCVDSRRLSAVCSKKLKNLSFFGIRNESSASNFMVRRGAEVNWKMDFPGNVSHQGLRCNTGVTGDLIYVRAFPIFTTDLYPSDWLIII